MSLVFHSGQHEMMEDEKGDYDDEVGAGLP